MKQPSSPFPIVAVILATLSSSCSDDTPTAPPVVYDGLLPARDLLADNHPDLWGTVGFTWRDPAPNDHGLAVESYHLASLPAAKTMPDLWSVATVLAVVPADTSGAYAVTLDDRDGIVPGEPTDFVVRPMYAGGHWGPVGESIDLTPSRPYTRSGKVMDELGRPLVGVTVRLEEPDDFTDPRGFVSEAVTDTEGRYEGLGPIHESTTMVLVTDSPDEPSAPDAEDAWFDFKTPPLAFGESGGETEIVLVTRLAFDPSADGIHDWTTMQLLQHLSFSMGNVYGEVENLTYRRWESYPLKIFIPAGVSENGAVYYDEEIRAAIEFWNTTFGSEVFVETLDEGGAQIVCTYEMWPRNNIIAGRMKFVPQTAPGENWGINVPVRAELFLNAEILNFDWVTQEIARHELAHALGCYDHTWDTAGMMYISGGGPEPLDYEVRILRALMGLPNLQEMNRYEGSYPDNPVY